MSTAAIHYLGRVKRAPQSGEKYSYATVEPLIESNSAGTSWLGPIRGSVERFPTRGRVHWHGAPAAVTLGSLWQFTGDEHPLTEPKGPEHYQLQNAQEAIEIIDLRKWGDEATLRSTITDAGIPLSFPPLARRVLLWLATDMCVGPLRLRQEQSS